MLMKPHFVITMESNTQGRDRWARRVNLHLQDDVGAGVCSEGRARKASVTSQYTLIFSSCSSFKLRDLSFAHFLKAEFLKS